jgi:DNA-binding NarL/FixJ family response regulator
LNVNPSTDDQPITLWVIEDNDTYRNTIAELVDNTEGMRCAHAFQSCEKALKALEDDFAPEIILMDIGLPGMSGIEGLGRIKAISPSTQLIMLTVFDDEKQIFDAICAGASGYLLKSALPHEIIGAVRQVLGGGAPMDARIARKVLDMFSRLSVPMGEYGLTAREREILHLMVDGLTAKGIAEKLFLSFRTIDTHVKNIYAKLHVHSRSGAVAKAFRERLL